MASGRSHRRGGYGRGPGGALRVLTVALALLAVPGLIHGTAGQMRPAPSPAGRAVIRLGGTLPPTRPFGATTTSWSGTALLGTTIVGAQPTSVTYDSGNHYLYVTNFGNPRGCGFPLCGNTVSIVSDANNTQVAAVAVGDDPLSGVYDPTNGGSSGIRVGHRM
jgi:DNA-binding beta-propeller fold protein YncE